MICILFGYQWCLYDKNYVNVLILVVYEMNKKNNVIISNKELLLNFNGVDYYS